MKKLQSILADWRELQVTVVPLVELGTEEALQPRSLDAVPFKYRPRLTDASDLHITRLRDDLRTSPSRELDPLLIAEVDGQLLVVDGHHRLEAYKRAGRTSVRARVRTTDLRTAVMVSKLVNCDGVKLALHPEQARDAAWQFIAETTARGRRPLGLSLRVVAAMFGVGRSTIERMVQRVPEVALGDYGPEALDPGTGWPRWRYVKGNAWNAAEAVVSPDALHRAKVDRFAGKLAKLIDGEATEVIRDAIALLHAEGRDEVIDLLDDWHDAEADANGGLDSDY